MNRDPVRPSPLAKYAEKVEELVIAADIVYVEDEGRLKGEHVVEYAKIRTLVKAYLKSLLLGEDELRVTLQENPFCL